MFIWHVKCYDFFLIGFLNSFFYCSVYVLRFIDTHKDMFSYDLSDEDAIEECQYSDPLNIDWVQFSHKGKMYSVAIGELPGRKYREIWRNLDKDLADLQTAGVSHVYCLSSHDELLKYRVPNLLEEYLRLGFIFHHHPIEDGTEPDIEQLLAILDDLKDILENGEKIFIHCFGGLDSSCVVAACLAMYCDASLTSSDAIHTVRMLKGFRAVQTVKQYNFINDFKELQRDHISWHPVRRLSR